MEEGQSVTKSMSLLYDSEVFLKADHSWICWMLFDLQDKGDRAAKCEAVGAEMSNEMSACVIERERLYVALL